MLFSSIWNDPAAYFISLLVALPGILIALCGHEAAHAIVANWCGDPTARLMGRISLDPRRHLDPTGFLCLLLVGFGWAKPVPVNPNHFKHPRRDDFFVSLAGITANLIMCVCFSLLVYLIVFIALAQIPTVSLFAAANPDGLAITTYQGKQYVLLSAGELPLTEVFRYASGIVSYSVNGTSMSIADLVIQPVLGTPVKYLMEIFGRAAMINLVLAIFNLIPIPPLDGYHVLNDLVLHRRLFAPQQAARVGMGILLALIVIGNIKPEWDVISIALSWVGTHVFSGIGAVMQALAGALKLI